MPTLSEHFYVDTREFKHNFEFLWLVLPRGRWLLRRSAQARGGGTVAPTPTQCGSLFSGGVEPFVLVPCALFSRRRTVPPRGVLGNQTPGKFVHDAFVGPQLVCLLCVDLVTIILVLDVINKFRPAVSFLFVCTPREAPAPAAGFFSEVLVFLF